LLAYEGSHYNLTEMDQVSAPTVTDDRLQKELAKLLGYDREAVAFLGISRLKGVGFQTLGQLGGRAGIAELLDAKDASEIIHRIKLPPGHNSRPVSWEEFRQTIGTLGKEAVWPLVDRRVRFLFAGDPEFPKALTAMPEQLRPKWLFVAGDLQLLDRPSLAIVGTREPSWVGEFLAQYAVTAACELGAPVVSGLAYGIDRLVHEWCLKLQVPTISVLGTGILAPYPAKHAPLSDAIVQAGGTVLTEYLPAQGPSGQQFVWRNRLQAALGRATIPVEWKKKSGTAHTVRFSRTLGRPVFGLQLVGAAIDPDAGESDHQFTVPNDHASVREAIQKAVAEVVPIRDDQQTDLFG
jgi:DNA processing protein